MSSLDDLYFGLWVSSAIVIFGVALEELSLFSKLKKLWFAWLCHGWIFAWNKIKSHRLAAIQSLGFILLVIGLAGELYFQTRIESEDAKVKNDSDIEIARLNTRASLAEAGAEQARLKQRTIEAAVAWRTLKQRQTEVLKTGLQKGSGSLTLGYIANDAESLFVAIQFSMVLDTIRENDILKWKVRFDPRSYSEKVMFDIFIPGPSNGPTEIVRKAFSEAEIAYHTEDVPNALFKLNGVTLYGQPSTTDVFIMIGSKRPFE